MTTSVTAEQIAKLRRMVNEPLNTVYSDVLLIAYIETYPIPDGLGHFPDEDEPITSATLWTPTYDLNAAAADIWDEKAATFADQYDFSADGGNYTRSQMYSHMMERARYYRSRRAPTTATLRKFPRELRGDEFPWIGNLPEPDD